MPTKDELTQENMELKGKIAELEAGLRVRDTDGEFEEPEEGAVYRYDGSGDFVKVVPLKEKVVAVVGEEAWNAVADVLDEDADDADVMIMLFESTAGVDGDAEAMAVADLARVTAERDEARNKLAMAQEKLRNAGALHGHIDDLKPVV